MLLNDFLSDFFVWRRFVDEACTVVINNNRTIVIRESHVLVGRGIVSEGIRGFNVFEISSGSPDLNPHF